MTDATLLHRQVNPSWIQQGRVTSQAFCPTPKDEKRLSVYDGDQISAEMAWNHFTVTLSHKSAGVLAVSASECLTCDVQPHPAPAQFAEHVEIDFSQHSSSLIKSIAKRLKSLAEARGWQYQAEAI